MIVLEYMLVFIAVVAALIAIIVNRKSLLACVVITAVAATLCLGFLLLYSNTHKLGSYGELVAFTLTCASVLTVILIVVTFIGVKMHFKKRTTKSSTAAPAPVSTAAAIETANRFGTRPTPVGIFGRQPIVKEPTPEKPVAPVVQPAPTAPVTPVQPAPAPIQTPTPSAALDRIIKKGEQFIALGQYILAEQMFVTFIDRTDDSSDKIMAELKLLDCHMDEGNREKAMDRLNGMVAKMRTGEYVFSPEQKRTLAECKMRLMKM